MTVDELLSFIENDTNEKTNNKSKKVKQKKNDKVNKQTLHNSNNINTNNINSSIQNNSNKPIQTPFSLDYISEKEIENEIENFKNRLRRDSIQIRNIVKMKPFFTKEWLISL